MLLIGSYIRTEIRQRKLTLQPNQELSQVKNTLMAILHECGVPNQMISTAGYELKQVRETHLA